MVRERLGFLSITAATTTTSHHQNCWSDIFFFFTQPRVSQSPLQTDNSLFNFQFFFFLLQSKFAKVQIETIQCQKSARYFVSTLQIVAARNRASTTLFVIHQGTLIGQSVMMHQLTSDSAIIELITQPRLGKTFSCLIM